MAGGNVCNHDAAGNGSSLLKQNWHRSDMKSTVDAKFSSPSQGSPYFRARGSQRYSNALPTRNDTSTPSESRGVLSVRNSTHKPLRVLLLEESEIDADLIRHELQRSGMKTTVERVDSAEAFTAALHNFAPDVVLADHSAAQFDSRSALELVREVRPTAPFIMIARAPTGAQTIDAIRAGAEDLILREYLSRLVASITDALAIRGPLYKLTDRQIEVLKLVAEGLRTREIAKRLSLSVKTVESHRGEIMKRLGIHDVVSLVRYAIRVSLIPSTYNR
jgi:DNA-binding NarL/FixJ family response regulator